MSWEQILQNDRPGEPLRQRIDALFAEQRETWPMLRDGEASLAHLQRKTLTSDGATVVVQVNPARRRSTLAKTDAQSVAARRCFLCPENMPVEERGVAFENLVIMPNPFPVLPLHCTIAAREHRPQQIEGQVGRMLRLAAEIGPNLAVFYNGPRCGASAPDHFHFQAAVAKEIPILAGERGLPIGRSLFATTNFGRHMIVARGGDLMIVERAIERAFNALRELQEPADEPMLNLLAYHDGTHYKAILFPRRAHRPACYFATGPDQLLISPAVLEMAGVLVATEAEHFERIDAEIARGIYQEVSIGDADFARLAAKII
ncbi:MAG TPA: DUF4922 domain-containing protein [Lacipirellulaceae bacterium]|jgi:hypothetical protein|nr:DUF4922 domain-containing protein [Lacipirellulaceae bacterium]